GDSGNTPDRPGNTCCHAAAGNSSSVAGGAPGASDNVAASRSADLPGPGTPRPAPATRRQTRVISVTTAAGDPTRDSMHARPLRVAMLPYRSKPHCGGQGIYLRHVSRELAALGHHVEVFSGQPYPELEPGPALRAVPSLDLYRDEDPFRTPRPGEFRDWVDLLEVAMMWTAAFPEPLTFSIRALRTLRQRRGHFDIVQDNQVLSYGMLGIA